LSEKNVLPDSGELATLPGSYAIMLFDARTHSLRLIFCSVSYAWRRNVVVSGVGLINEVNRHWARLVLGCSLSRLRAGKPSRYVTSHLGQLSLPSLRGR